MITQSTHRFLKFLRRPVLERDVTVVVTSCDRHDLLDKSLDTFHRFNTYDGVKEILVVEDGTADPSVVCNRHKARLIRMGERVGQVRAIDRAYAEVTTRYIFHMEDDWEFYRPGFIEKSKAVLEADPSTLCVWLRAWTDTNRHPLSFRAEDGSFGVLAPGFDLVWHGFTFNPGLRRLSDYKALGSFAAVLQGAIHFEAEISQAYGALGYRAVILDKAGYVRHLGWDRHVA
ncbi:glycosyltransferase family 2 protein [Methylobacterium sp. WL12]|uniref:glycosyltransferase family 2 protein n=1 Tax=Methylobacterium sp. WL12 TaxID=2603890 RepID=UPI0011C8A9CB|nr:glycosyltransferase [Methylobacterium sp. WL12]TXM67543.1 glycosyltransferase family 2 protein [Methylobacterium sp. WL12]